MSFDISGFGIQARIVASNTFPLGFTVTQFSDDADPFDVGSQTIAETAMTLNGDLIKWSTATIIPVTINVIPNSEDDLNLAVLLEANRVGQGKTSARDVITIVATYPDPDTRTTTFINGAIVEGMTANSIASGGRFKTKNYLFNFENKSEN